jgi:CubicO group peptidase (beta-lactamase class C family)
MEPVHRVAVPHFQVKPLRETELRAASVTPAANAIVGQAIDKAVRDGREIGVQVAAYLDGKLVIDAWGGLADPTTGRKVDGDTLFNTYSVTKAVAATALHIQADRGLIDYVAPVARYWPEYAANGKAGRTRAGRPHASRVCPADAGGRDAAEDVRQAYELGKRPVADMSPRCGMKPKGLRKSRVHWSGKLCQTIYTHNHEHHEHLPAGRHEGVHRGTGAIARIRDQ